MLLKTGLVLSLLFLGQIKEENFLIQLVNFGSFLVLGSFILSSRSQKNILRNISLMILTLLVLMYSILAISVINKSINISLDEPVSCTSDEQDFLKTFYLMKKGLGYYNSYASALVNCGGFQQAPKDSASWRFPTSFYLWKLLAQNGKQIRIIFLIFSLITMLSSYLLMKKVTNYKIALLSPYLLIPYFLEAISGHSFIFMEWWGLFFFIVGLTALYYEKRGSSLGFLILSVFCRELFIVPVILILLIDCIHRRNIRYLSLFLVSVAMFWILHQINIARTVGELSFQSRIHSFDKISLMSTLAFSTKTFKFVFLRIGTLFPIIAVIGLIRFYSLVKNTNKKFAYFALASFFILILLAPFIVTRATYNGVFQYGDYWGITFVPVAIIFAPIILASKSDRF